MQLLLPLKAKLGLKKITEDMPTSLVPKQKSELEVSQYCSNIFFQALSHFC